MAAHGGFFLNYYSGSEVTHIICANLPDTKLKHLERTKQRYGTCNLLLAQAHKAPLQVLDVSCHLQGPQAHRAPRVDCGLPQSRHPAAGEHISTC